MRRYHPRNLLLSGIIPGPHEATGDELQHALRIDTDEKLDLYQNGFIASTSSCPQGRRCRVVCIMKCCDHPALCRVDGHADHAHKLAFCTMCKAKRDELRTERGMTKEFEPRTAQEHRMYSDEYRDASLADREVLFRRTGVRYAESTRLPYFDPIVMGVIDPMHNILLGICRTLWMDAWIRKNVLRRRTAKKRRELDRIHAYLRKFEMPSWVGRLPRQVGYPAGGSLSADEYKALVLVYCPLIIPLIWREWFPIDQEEFRKRHQRWETLEAQCLQRIANGTATTDDQMQKNRPQPQQMHENDTKNFLKLATALKIILGRSVKCADLTRAENLLKEYLQGFLQIHKDCVKPNHHYITHIFDQIRSYGPVYGFWTFTGERLNKLLKSIKTNNHSGGEIEVSFFRGFTRDVKLREKLRNLAKQTSSDDVLSFASRALIRENEAPRGTVASMTAMIQEIDEISEDYNKTISLSAASNMKRIEDELQNGLLKYYNRTEPQADVVSRTSAYVPGINLLNIKADFFSATKAPNSIIQTEFDGELFVGQVISVFSHKQQHVPGPRIFLHVRWFRSRLDIDTSDWDPYPELEVKFWEFNTFLTGEGPPAIIPPSLVKSQACRVTVNLPQVLLRKPPPAPENEEDEEDEEDDEDEENTRVKDDQAGGEDEQEPEIEEGDGELVWATIGLSKARYLFSLSSSLLNSYFFFQDVQVI
ncbi:hypothetical protein ACEPAG_9044 [Sanghuangporus baumii]